MILWVGTCFSQEKTNERILKVEGQVAFSFGKNTICFNIGGPKLQLLKFKKVSVSFVFFPTLRYGTETKKIIPTLGASPEIGIGIRFGLIAPFYYTTQEGWIPTFGAKFKF